MRPCHLTVRSQYQQLVQNVDSTKKPVKQKCNQLDAKNIIRSVEKVEHNTTGNKLMEKNK